MDFPKHVYKRGTGKKANESGLHTAESTLVQSKEELAALGAGWCESPVEATTAAPAKAKHEPEPEPEAAEEEKHAPKVEVFKRGK